GRDPDPRLGDAGAGRAAAFDVGTDLARPERRGGAGGGAGRLGARRGHHPDGPRRAGPRRAVAARPEPAGARLRAQRPLRLLLGREPAGGHRGLGAAAVGRGLPGGLHGQRLHRRVPGVAAPPAPSSPPPGPSPWPVEPFPGPGVPSSVPSSGADGLGDSGRSGPPLGSGGTVPSGLGSSVGSVGSVGSSVGGSAGSSPAPSVCGGSDVSEAPGAVGVLCPPLPEGVRPPLPCPEDVPPVLPVRRGGSDEPRSRSVGDPARSAAGVDGSAEAVGSPGDGVPASVGAPLGSYSVVSGSVGSGSAGSGVGAGSRVPESCAPPPSDGAGGSVSASV